MYTNLFTIIICSVSFLPFPTRKEIKWLSHLPYIQVTNVYINVTELYINMTNFYINAATVLLSLCIVK